MKKAIEQMCKDLRIGNIVSQNYQDIEADSYEEFLYKVLKSETPYFIVSSNTLSAKLIVDSSKILDNIFIYSRCS